MAYKVIFLDKDKKDKLILNWQTDKYHNFYADFKGEKVFEEAEIRKNKIYGFTLTDYGTIELKLSSNFLNPGLEVLKDGRQLPGSVLFPPRIINVSFWLLMLIAAGNLLIGLLDLLFGFNYVAKFYIDLPSYLVVSEGVVILFLSLLFRYRLSKIALVFASTFVFVDLLANIRFMIEFPEVLMEGILGSFMYLLWFCFIIRSMWYLDQLKQKVAKLKSGKFCLIFGMPLLLAYLIFCYQVNYNLFYVQTYTEQDYRQIGWEDGYLDGSNNTSVCVSCQQEFKNNDIYLESYHEGYYDGCRDENSGCEANLPVKVLEELRGNNLETDEENVS